ncbi:hypothetical protein CB1_001415001 [Camelus ferus]|nr:hypothetical protein CB1_001415001 [Camelus ferus]
MRLEDDALGPGSVRRPCGRALHWIRLVLISLRLGWSYDAYAIQLCTASTGNIVEQVVCLMAYHLLFATEHESDMDPSSPLPPGANCLHSRDKCKQINTFIHEDLATVAAFCNTPAVPCTSSLSLSSCHNSTHDVSVTDCFARAGTRPPYCHYHKKDSTRPIRVGCEEGEPVHLDG